jgi:hypothetical protein
MAAKRDFESIALEVIAAVKANLNTKIAAINTEKGDDVTLADVDAGAYVYQRFGQEIANYDPFIEINVGSDFGETAGAESSERIRVLVDLVTSDRGYAGSEKVLKLLARYRRALREVLADQFQSVRGLKVSSLPTFPFTDPEGRNLFSVAAGIEFNIVS